MANYDANKIRNIVFLGHQSSGKTSLVESLYFLTGGTNQKGEVEKKNTVSDYLPEEQKRQQSLQCAIAPLEYKNYKFNFIDLPGNDDFVSEIIGVTLTGDSAEELDALSTTALMMGMTAAAGFLKLFGAEAVFVTRDRKIYTTDGLKGLLEFV